MNQPPKPSKQAVWSLILGILSNLCLWILGSIPAIILGIIGMKKADADPENVGGKGMSLAGLICGAVGLMVGFLPVVTVAGIIASLTMPAAVSISENAKLTVEMNQARQIILASHHYAGDNDGNLPPDLQTLVPDYLDDPALLKVESPDGSMADFLYRTGLNIEKAGLSDPVILSPNTRMGKRVVGFLDGQVKALRDSERAGIDSQFSGF
ncbi:MAG: DUF4190 domain-containing protein [Verrucomicrobiales bacterium]|nr:DUF4190 domain-containing protein [Verrucomicrobiales bacterium]